MSDPKNSPQNNPKEQFHVPKGYFEKSGLRLFNKIDCIEELKDFPLLSNLKKENVFVTPDEYFQKSALQLELIEFEKLSGLSKLQVFDIPNHYFDQKAGAIIDELLPLNNVSKYYSELNQISKANVFETPPNYFDARKERILNTLKEKKSAKIFHLSFGQASMAAAAILIISLGFWFYPEQEKIVSPDDCDTLACIEKRELLQSKQIENLDDDELFELVNPAKLEQKLNPMNKSDNSAKKKDSSDAHKISDELLDEI